jgi:putative DNA-binding protein
VVELDLAGLQTWMLSRVTAGAWGQRLIAGDGVAAVDIIRGSPALSADDRLDIYARSYVLRLAECLRAEFPALRALIGGPTFDLFAGGYLSARPPSAPSLYELGAGFADYLDATRPEPRSQPGTLEALPASLARLERAIAESSRARGPEDAGGAASLDLAALMYDPLFRLRTPESLRMLRLDFDFTDVLASERAGRRPSPPEPGDALVAVARSDYRVSVHRLDPLQFAFLEAVRDGDGVVTGAARLAAEAVGREHTGVVAGLLAWTVRAIELGMLALSGEGGI